ncbi:MAG: FadR/GntR family transcriptional regulator [Pseudomonadota bacterium]
MANEGRLYRSVFKKMSKLIDSGEYPPGGRLPPERELAARFGVSRPTIREAIIALEALDRVKVKTGSGVYVLDGGQPTPSVDPRITAFELTEARAMIEGEAAAQAALLISDEQLLELQATVDAMAGTGSNNLQDADRSDQRFHQIISEATQNTMLESVIASLWHVRDHSPKIRQAHQSLCEVDSQARITEHQRICEALSKRDPAAARQAMHAHFARLLNKLIAADETAQIEQARQRATESRERFSLSHLVTRADARSS